MYPVCLKRDHPQRVGTSSERSRDAATQTGDVSSRRASLRWSPDEIARANGQQIRHRAVRSSRCRHAVPHDRHRVSKPGVRIRHREFDSLQASEDSRRRVEDRDVRAEGDVLGIEVDECVAVERGESEVEASAVGSVDGGVGLAGVDEEREKRGDRPGIPEREII
jgi:hypothetical protein